MMNTIELDPKRLGTLAEKRAEKQPEVAVPLWMAFACAVCGALIVSIPMLTVGYWYGEQDMERAAYRAGVGEYHYDAEGKREFLFISDRNQYPAKPNKPVFFGVNLWKPSQ